MSSDIPDWIRLACGRWGRQKRRIWSGSEWYVNPLGGRQRHVDGYAESLMGRIKDERVAAGGSGTCSQHWEEVFWGDGLDVQRAIIGMPEAANDALHVKYVWDPEFNLTPLRKAAILGLKERAYWEAVGRAEFWVFARLDRSAAVDDLRLRRESAKNLSITATMPKLSPPDINLPALNRIRLRLPQ